MYTDGEYKYNKDIIMSKKSVFSQFSKEKGDITIDSKNSSMWFHEVMLMLEGSNIEFKDLDSKSFIELFQVALEVENPEIINKIIQLYDSIKINTASEGLDIVTTLFKYDEKIRKLSNAQISAARKVSRKFPMSFAKLQKKCKIDYSVFEILDSSLHMSLMPQHAQQVSSFALKHISNVKSVLDATAHVGCDTVNFALMWPNAFIDAIEKNTETFEILKNNLARFTLLTNRRPDLLEAKLGDSSEFDISGYDVVYFDPPWEKKERKILLLSGISMDNIVRRVLEQKNKYVLVKAPPQYISDIPHVKEIIRSKGKQHFKLLLYTPGKDTIKPTRIWYEKKTHVYENPLGKLIQSLNPVYCDLGILIQAKNNIIRLKRESEKLGIFIPVNYNSADIVGFVENFIDLYSDIVRKGGNIRDKYRDKFINNTLVDPDVDSLMRGFTDQDLIKKLRINTAEFRSRDDISDHIFKKIGGNTLYEISYDGFYIIRYFSDKKNAESTFRAGKNMFFTKTKQTNSDINSYTDVELRKLAYSAHLYLETRWSRYVSTLYDTLIETIQETEQSKHKKFRYGSYYALFNSDLDGHRYKRIRYMKALNINTMTTSKTKATFSYKMFMKLVLSCVSSEIDLSNLDKAVIKNFKRKRNRFLEELKDFVGIYVPLKHARYTKGIVQYMNNMWFMYSCINTRQKVLDPLSINISLFINGSNMIRDMFNDYEILKFYPSIEKLLGYITKMEDFVDAIDFVLHKHGKLSYSHDSLLITWNFAYLSNMGTELKHRKKYVFKISKFLEILKRSNKKLPDLTQHINPLYLLLGSILFPLGSADVKVVTKENKNMVDAVVSIIRRRERETGIKPRYKFVENRDYVEFNNMLGISN
uniref:Methyltransferase n=1 Tax=Pithovirus LCDPAC01 TaxID=2506600 RepID=A0A481YNG5_9VIRU|nr:MAG: hypothetical protein LCDPAC01_01180 [Pithovirus LCDPAC01]